MAINRNNYGAYFLDYWESNLDEQAKSALASFLQANPDLQDEFFDFKDAANANILQDEIITYPDKRTLKKIEVQPIGEISQMNWEYFVIASIEGDLPAEKNKLFEDFVRLNPQIINEIRLYRKARLSPDQTIVFQEKSLLKRRILPIWISGNTVRQWISVAAVILIAIILYRNDSFFRSTSDSVSQIVENVSPVDDTNQTFIKSDDEQKLPSAGAGYLKPEQSGKKYSDSQALVHRYTDNSSGLTDDETPDYGREGIQLAKLEMIPQKRLNDVELGRNFPEKNRNEFSEIFDYLMIRDGLVSDAKADKSLANKVLVGIKSTFIRGEIQPVQGILSPVLNGVTENGREVLSRSGLVLPVLNKLEEDGRKETSFALSETLNFRLSRIRNTSE